MNYVNRMHLRFRAEIALIATIALIVGFSYLAWVMIPGLLGK